MHVMHACRFVVCLAFVFGDARSVHVNVDIDRNFGQWLKEACLLDKNCL